MTEPHDPAGPSLEEALARLREIVATMERGSVELDASLALFEEGFALVRSAERTLGSAEARIEQLLDDGAGGVRALDFEPGG
jgi:exodeoxyribonuclease VII small subunit